MRILKIILLTIIFATIGCKSERKLNGNYSSCYNGLYAELYIENDSMQSATSMNWISNWRKFEIKNDTLYHLHFGELGNPAKAKINYIRKDEFELFYPKDTITYTLKRIDIEIDDKTTYEEFWDGFDKRKLDFDCFY